MNSLTAFWAEACTSGPPYIHPADLSFFERYRPRDLRHAHVDADTFPQDKLANDPHFFHLSLLPVPYIGDLERADVFVLMLNPGFEGPEYAAEALPGVEDALRSTLSQTLTSAEYPFWYLDPAQEHPGATYWGKKVKGVGDNRHISQRLAVLQMMPYHSKKFDADRLTRELPSAQIAKDYVQRVVVPKARAGEVLLIVARQVRNWGFEQGDDAVNVVVYSRGESRGAQVSSGSRGGKAIMEWLSREN